MEEIEINEQSEITDQLFAEIRKTPDERVDRSKRHSLCEVFFVVLCAQICNLETFREYEYYGKLKLDFLRRFLPYKYGAPSRSTIGRILAMLQANKVEELFIKWREIIVKKNSASEVQKELPTIAIDGKRHCGVQGEELHIVTAFDTQTGMVLGGEAVADKSNEITAIPKLLSVLEIKNQIVSIDAIGCQKNIAEQIRSQEADYFLALKKNQGNLHEQVKDFFENEKCRQTCESIMRRDKGHGRIETRTCYVMRKIDWLEKKNEWKDLNAIAMIESKRIIKGKEATDRRFFITSSVASAEILLAASRAHWGIENSSHWVLDVIFREDSRILWNKNLAHNESVIRRMALNLVRQYRSIRPRRSERSEKIAIKTLRKIIILSDDEMTQLLSMGF